MPVSEIAEGIMDEIEEKIREKALLRLSGIFHVSVAALSPERRFGEGLKASFVSDFRRNEFDQVSDDIHDVADRTVAAELGSGNLTIKTVGDYCDLMVRCSRTKPKDVKRILGVD
jgi:GMP synthase PP-ATPase subunit